MSKQIVTLLWRLNPSSLFVTARSRNELSPYLCIARHSSNLLCSNVVANTVCLGRNTLEGRGKEVIPQCNNCIRDVKYNSSYNDKKGIYKKIAECGKHTCDESRTCYEEENKEIGFTQIGDKHQNEKTLLNTKYHFLFRQTRWFSSHLNDSNVTTRCFSSVIEKREMGEVIQRKEHRKNPIEENNNAINNHNDISAGCKNSDSSVPIATCNGENLMTGGRGSENKKEILERVEKNEDDEDGENGKIKKTENNSETDIRKILSIIFYASIPMIGFGFMDQFIMIRLGDIFDTSIGVTFGISTLCAASFGQLCSDTLGVFFGNFLNYLLQKFKIIKPPKVDTKSKVYQYCILFGSVIGILLGCSIGMIQLLFMDTSKSDRLKKKKELDSIFQMVMGDCPNIFKCETCTLFLYDQAKNELWSKAVHGMKTIIKIPVNDNDKGFNLWVLKNKEIINCKNVANDDRYNREHDIKCNFKTRTLLAAPILDRNNEVIGVIMFLNKLRSHGGYFTNDDEKLIEVMSRHISIFMEKFNYISEGDKKMIIFDKKKGRAKGQNTQKDTDTTIEEEDEDEEEEEEDEDEEEVEVEVEKREKGNIESTNPNTNIHTNVRMETEKAYDIGENEQDGSLSFSTDKKKKKKKKKKKLRSPVITNIEDDDDKVFDESNETEQVTNFEEEEEEEEEVIATNRGRGSESGSGDEDEDEDDDDDDDEDDDGVTQQAIIINADHIGDVGEVVGEEEAEHIMEDIQGETETEAETEIEEELEDLEDTAWNESVQHRKETERKTEERKRQTKKKKIEENQEYDGDEDIDDEIMMEKKQKEEKYEEKKKKEEIQKMEEIEDEKEENEANKLLLAGKYQEVEELKEEINSLLQKKKINKDVSVDKNIEISKDKILKRVENSSKENVAMINREGGNIENISSNMDISGLLGTMGQMNSVKQLGIMEQLDTLEQLETMHNKREQTKEERNIADKPEEEKDITKKKEKKKEKEKGEGENDTYDTACDMNETDIASDSRCTLLGDTHSSHLTNGFKELQLNEMYKLRGGKNQEEDKNVTPKEDEQNIYNKKEEEGNINCDNRITNTNAHVYSNVINPNINNNYNNENSTADINAYPWTKMLSNYFDDLNEGEGHHLYDTIAIEIVKTMNAFYAYIKKSAHSIHLKNNNTVKLLGLCNIKNAINVQNVFNTATNEEGGLKEKKDNEIHNKYNLLVNENCSEERKGLTLATRTCETETARTEEGKIETEKEREMEREREIKMNMNMVKQGGDSETEVKGKKKETDGEIKRKTTEKIVAEIEGENHESTVNNEIQDQREKKSIYYYSDKDAVLMEQCEIPFQLSSMSFQMNFNIYNLPCWELTKLLKPYKWFSENTLKGMRVVCVVDKEPFEEENKNEKDTVEREREREIEKGKENNIGGEFEWEDIEQKKRNIKRKTDTGTDTDRETENKLEEIEESGNKSNVEHMLKILKRKLEEIETIKRNTKKTKQNGSVTPADSETEHLHTETVQEVKDSVNNSKATQNGAVTAADSETEQLHNETVQEVTDSVKNSKKRKKTAALGDVLDERKKYTQNNYIFFLNENLYDSSFFGIISKVNKEIDRIRYEVSLNVEKLKMKRNILLCDVLHKFRSGGLAEEPFNPFHLEKLFLSIAHKKNEMKYFKLLKRICKYNFNRILINFNKYKIIKKRKKLIKFCYTFKHFDIYKNIDMWDTICCQNILKTMFIKHLHLVLSLQHMHIIDFKVLHNYLIKNIFENMNIHFDLPPHTIFSLQVSRSLKKDMFCQTQTYNMRDILFKYIILYNCRRKTLRRKHCYPYYHYNYNYLDAFVAPNYFIENTHTRRVSKPLQQDLEQKSEIITVDR